MRHRDRAGMGRAWALSAVLVAAATNTSAAAAPAADPEEPAARDNRAAAKAAFARGREAAGNGDYATALTEFEEAQRLEPTGGIHYNIAVCHHALMLEAEPQSDAYETHRREAIDAYNRYLRATPDAKDVEQVEQTISSLGGHPVTQKRWTVERVDPDPAPDLRETADETEPGPPDVGPEGPQIDTGEDAQPTPQPPKKIRTPWLPSGRAGAGVVLALSNLRQMIREDDVDDDNEVENMPMLGLVIRGGAFIGPRHRLNLGGEIALYGQPSTRNGRHRLGAGHIGVTADYGHPLGTKRRFEIGGGGMIALTGQTLRIKGESSANCPLGNVADNTSDADDRDASRRGGLLLAGRLTLAALLGKRRNHELALRISPGLGLFGVGDKGDCENTSLTARSPFQEFGMAGPNGPKPAFVMTVDLGYAPRF